MKQREAYCSWAEHSICLIALAELPQFVFSKGVDRTIFCETKQKNTTFAVIIIIITQL